MRLRKSTRKFLKITVIFLLLSLYLIDFTPQALIKYWARYPKLDKLRLLTKPLDIFYLSGLLPKSQIPHYRLNIKPQNLAKLSDSLPEPYTFTIYDRSRQKTVPATFVENALALPAKVRIHGDLYQHWSGSKKSYKVEFNKRTFNGFSQIALILPETRDFYIESLASYRAQKLGLINLNSWFASLEINGQSQGIYFVQEHWTKDVLEKNTHNSDSDLFGELDLINQWSWPRLFENVDAWKKYTVNPNSPTDFASIDQLIKLLDQSQDPHTLIDIDSFASWQAHSMLFPSFHQDDGHNMRILFNSSSGLFEFIPYDLELNQPTKDIDQTKYNTLVTLLLENPDIKAKRDKVLTDYVKDKKNLRDDLKFTDTLFLKTRAAFGNDKQKAYSTLFYTRTYLKNRYNLIKQFKLLRKVYL